MTSLPVAVRSLLRARVFTLASVVTVALCTAAACSVFAIVNAVLLRPLPYADADRLVGMWHTLPGVDIPVAKQSLGTYTLSRETAKSFDAMGLYLSLAGTVAYESSNSAPERARVGYMTPSMFTLLGARPVIGRSFTKAEAANYTHPVALISEAVWRGHFGADMSVLGKTIGVDGVQRTIIGVMPRAFAFPEPRTPVWIPLDVAKPTYLGSFGYDGIGRLRAGISPEAAQRELAQILPRAAERFPEQRPGVPTAMVLQKTRIAPVIHRMRDDVVAGFEPVLWLVAATVALLVVVAFSNVASLLLVRIEARSRELAVRRALGASSATIWMHLALESLIVTGAGTVVGLAATSFIVQGFVHAAAAGVPRIDEIRVDAVVCGVGGALMLLFASATAVIGMLRVRGRDTMPLLRDAGRTIAGGRSAQRLRAAFVGVEVAMSLALLAGSAVLGRSMLHLRDVQPGFDPSNVFTFWTFLPSTTYKGVENTARFYREAIERMRALPGVVSVAATAKLPLEVEGYPYRSTIWPDNGVDVSSSLPPIVQATTITSTYFETMHIPLIAGRTFDDATIRRGALEAVASRGYVERAWHDPSGRSAVGKRVRPMATGSWFTIVAVVGDVRDSTLTQSPVPEVYFSEEPSADTTGGNTTSRGMGFVVRTRGPQPGLPSVLRAELHALDPALPFHRAEWMSDIVADSRASMSFALIVLGAGAAATLVLGIVGLYGSIAYVVSLRTREITIRIALGLDPASAPGLMLREATVVVLAGTVVGAIIYLAFARLLGSLTFGVRPNDPALLADAVVMVMIIAGVAMWVPARRASRVNPADALKAD